MSSNPTLKQLVIKTNTVKRLAKDKQGYLKEAEENRQHIQKLIEQEKHEADVRKQKEVLEETLSMVPHMDTKITAAVSDLKNFISTVESQQEFADSEELENARHQVVLASATS